MEMQSYVFEVLVVPFANLYAHAVDGEYHKQFVKGLVALHQRSYGCCISPYGTLVML